MIISYSIFALLSLLTAPSFQQSSPCKTQLFKQKVDHDPYTKDTSTFEQRYQTKADYYKPDGPILFFQGDEAPAFQCIEELVIDEWAKELGAYIVNIEHRFFGDSLPSNATNLVERYKSLTLDNVLADSTSLISHVKSTNSSLDDAKVIIFGGW